MEQGTQSQHFTLESLDVQARQTVAWRNLVATVGKQEEKQILSSQVQK